jgi:ArsR family transcriptional regulator
MWLGHPETTTCIEQSWTMVHPESEPARTRAAITSAGDPPLRPAAATRDLRPHVATHRPAYTSIVIEVMTIDRSPLQQDQAVTLLAVVADPVRWRLIAELATAGTRCVCDLQPVAGVAPNVLSYHLKVLREANLVTSAKRGRWVDYTLADDARDRITAALPTAGTPQVRQPAR